MLGFSQKPLPISFGKFPKTEQHVHIEATTSLELLEKMAKRNELLDIFEELKPILYQFSAKNFLEFLTAYDLISLFINTPEDVTEMVLDYLRRCKNEGLTHVALTCSYDHTKAERDIFIDFAKTPADYSEVEKAADSVRRKLKARAKPANLTYEQYVDAVSTAIEQGLVEGISAEIIMVILRHNPIEQAQELLDHIQRHPNPHVTTIGLAGDEVNNPAAKFSTCFARARTELGLKIAPHVCELAPPKFLHDALTEMGPLCRVGHAITAPKDVEAMQRLFNLSNPATYFLRQQGLAQNTRALLEQLSRNGILENDVDEANLKSQLEQQFQDKTSRECLEYLFQPLCVELSLTSNLLLIENINALAHHPIMEFIRAGIRISINSDDPKFWNNRVQNADFPTEDFRPSALGCSVGQEWEKVKRLYQLDDAQMLKIYRDSVVSMGCHKLLKIRLLKYADLYEAFHEVRAKLSSYQNDNINSHIASYQLSPTQANAQALLNVVKALCSELPFVAEVKLAEILVAKHDAFAASMDAYHMHLQERSLVVMQRSQPCDNDVRKDKKFV